MCRLANYQICFSDYQNLCFFLSGCQKVICKVTSNWSELINVVD